MALRKPQTETAPAQGGGFEQEDGPVVATQEKAANPAPTDTQQATAGVEATKAIAKAATTAVATTANTAVGRPAGKLVGLLDEQRDAMPAVEFGTLTRLVGSNGLVMDKDNKKLGNFVTLEVISWNETYVLSPGVDDDESKKHVKYSLDGERVAESGQTCAEYLEYLRTVEKYDKASMKKYNEVVGILLDSGTKVEELTGTLVQLSLSPSSRKLFDGYCMQEAVKIRMGKRSPDGATIVKFTTDVRTQNGKNFTVLKPSAA